MKIAHYNQMMKYLTRPPEKYSKEEKKKIVKDFYKKAEQPKSKPMPITKYIDRMNQLYGNKTDEYGNEETATDRIRDPKFFQKKLPKKIVQKPKPKPTYLNGNVIDITPLINDEWWKILDYPLIPEEDPSEKTRRRYERLKQLEEERIVAKGLGNLLKLKKYRYES